MVSVRPELEQVWKELQRAGASDDLEVVEYIAALLLEDSQISASDEMPHRPPIRYGILEGEQRRSLNEAAREVGGKAALFDPHVLFYSSRLGSAKESGAYPVPRHIVTFMLRLLDIRPEHDLADFTCGSGGFLVYRNHPDVIGQQSARKQHPGQSVGVELSPRWARIARGNAALHGMSAPKTRIYTGDAFIALTQEEELSGKKFDRIAMAPPFSAHVDPFLARQALGRILPETMWQRDTGYTSEVLFPWLALDRLRPGGRGIVVARTSLLYTESNNPKLLRQHLVTSRTLRAVVQLGQGMLAPFFGEAVYLLLLDKDERGQGDWPWFFRVERDGYSSDGRPYLANGPDQPEVDDMPFAQATLQLDSSASQDEQAQNYEELSFRAVGAPEDRLGIVIQVHKGATLASIRFFQVDEGPRQGSYLLVKAALEGQAARCWEVALARDRAWQPSPNMIPDEGVWIRQLYPQGLIGSAGRSVIEGGIAGQLFAIARDGRLLGDTQPWEHLGGPDYNLQPETYVPSSKEKLEPAARLLTGVRRDERALTRIVDTLLGNLEVQQRIGRQLPPPPRAFDDLSLIQLLGPEQESIYKQIKALARQTGGYASYFTPEQLARLPDSADIVTIRQTLDLLEHMGIIVQVTVKAPGKEKTRPYYRLVTELDVRKIEQ
jgi:type I restriction enzyme M protein